MITYTFEDLEIAKKRIRDRGYCLEDTKESGNYRIKTVRQTGIDNLTWRPGETIAMLRKTGPTYIITGETEGVPIKNEVIRNNLIKRLKETRILDKKRTNEEREKISA
jgi:hypothetical protein